MRKLIVSTFVTLDGVMQAPGAPEEDTSGGFTSGGWSVNFWDDMMNRTMDEFMSKPFDLLLGRKTYEIFAAYWPNATDQPGADKLNNTRKYVVSSTLDHVDWSNSTLIKGDAVQEITRLKEQDGPDLWVNGSSILLQTLLKHNLIDELLLWIFPVVIGNGKRLFGGGTYPSSLKLIDSQVSSTGVVLATYQPGGELNAGSFALDQPSRSEIASREEQVKKN